MKDLFTSMTINPTNWMKLESRSGRIVSLVALSLAIFVPSTLRGQSIALLEETVITQAVDAVLPSVVRIETVGGLEHIDNVRLPDGPTTGLVVSSDGYLVSSAFNFMHKPTSILITTSSGARMTARIVARDHSRNLVLLKVESATPLPVPIVAPSSEILTGQTVIAIGRSFTGPGPGVSVGIVSATDRIWGRAIQTDANVSSGNYGGPLIDLRGRVVGVLTPLSPQAQHEAAGAEWYDGGIGFAVPLTSVQARLAQWKQGTDLFPGLMGISMKSPDLYGPVSEIANCQLKSPAHAAGIRARDQIVKVDGVAVSRLGQLQHLLGPKYAGDTVRITYQRGEVLTDVDLVLTDKIEPYAYPFIGVLPMRDATPNARGVTVRYVYPNSPAAAAGVQVGDVIENLAASPIADADIARVVLAAFEPGQTISIHFRRGTGDPMQREITLAPLPDSLPGVLPASHSDAGKAIAGGAPTGLFEISLPDIPNKCWAIVPDNYHPDVARGVLVVLPPAGEFKSDEFMSNWKDVASQFNLIIAAPLSREARGWMADEATVPQRLIEHLQQRYRVDRQRIVTYGQQAGGSLAFVAWTQSRDLIRGVVAVDGTFPFADNGLATDPMERIAFVAFLSEQVQRRQVIESRLQQLRDRKFPVLQLDIAGKSRDLTAAEKLLIAQWIDSLDRL